MAEYTTQLISHTTRKRKAALTLGVTFFIPGFVVGLSYVEGQIGWPTLAILPFFALGLWASYRYWSATEVQVPTPEALAAQEAADAAGQRKQAELEDKWYYRYPVAAFMLLGAFFMLSEKPNLWWMSAILVVGAAVHARELSFIAVVLGGGYMLLKGIASLPTSAAIIIGALIIASAMRRNRT